MKKIRIPTTVPLFKGDVLQDEYRGYPVELDFESKLDVRSCFAMNTFDEFIDKKGVFLFWTTS